MSDLEKRLSGISRAVDAVTRRARETVDARLGKPVPQSTASTAEPAIGPFGAEKLPDGAARGPVATLSIPALHKLERFNAELRHSLVEDSLYNLRVLTQALPERHTSGEYRQKLGRSLGTLDLVLEHLHSYFSQELEPGVTVRNVISGVARDAERAALDLKELSGVDLDSLAEETAAASFSQQAVAAVDLLLRTVDLAGGCVREIMHSPVELLERVIETHQDAARAKKAEIQLVDETDSQPRLIGREAMLANAYSELTRNALVHAFADGPSDGVGRKLVIRVAWSDPRRQYLRVTFADNGCGFSEEVAGALGQRGVSTRGAGEGLAMVRRIVEGEHLGRVEFGRSDLGGAEVRLLLPYRFAEEK